MIPPPQLNERDYSTCESCCAQDAASKKRKREGTIKNSGHQPAFATGVEKGNQIRERDAESRLSKGNGVMTMINVSIKLP